RRTVPRFGSVSPIARCACGRAPDGCEGTRTVQKSGGSVRRTSKRRAPGSRPGAAPRMRARGPAMTMRSDDPLVHFRRRRSRNEVELVIGRSATRLILALIAIALAAALALTGSSHAREVLDVVRRLPF